MVPARPLFFSLSETGALEGSERDQGVTLAAA